MDRKDKLTKTEKILLGMTAVFFCVLLALYAGRDRAVVTTDRSAAPEDVVPETEMVNLNTAGAVALSDLPGIGPVLAERIIAYRETHGPFETPEALMNVDGIGKGKYSGLEGLITVEEETHGEDTGGG